MVAISSDILLSVAVGFVSSAISVAATWYFARQRYQHPSKSVPSDGFWIQLIKGRLDFNVFMLLSLLVFTAAMVAILTVNAVFHLMVIWITSLRLPT